MTYVKDANTHAVVNKLSSFEDYERQKKSIKALNAAKTEVFNVQKEVKDLKHEMHNIKEELKRLTERINGTGNNSS